MPWILTSTAIFGSAGAYMLLAGPSAPAHHGAKHGEEHGSSADTGNKAKAADNDDDDEGKEQKSKSEDDARETAEKEKKDSNVSQENKSQDKGPEQKAEKSGDKSGDKDGDKTVAKGSLDQNAAPKTVSAALREPVDRFTELIVSFATTERYC